MEVDTNELLHRIGAVLRVISDKMDWLIEIGERVDGEVRLPSELEAQTVADVLMDDACIPSDAVAEEPAKKWRILEPGEVVQEGDWMNAKVNSQKDGPPGGGWMAASSFCFGKEASASFHLYFARPVADEPAKEAEPAWEPKVGDWVKVTRPEDWRKAPFPHWDSEMHKFDGQVGQIEREREGHFQIRGFVASKEWQYIFHRDWLSPATTSQPLKLPPSLATVSGSGGRESKPYLEDEYREPVVPADAGKECEFSDNGNDWTEGKLRGYAGHLWQSVSSEVVGAKCWFHARIKKDA